MSFSDYIQKSTASLDELPLVHTTEYFNLPLIRLSHTLEPRNCKVFGEPLLYFFYGRPAYRDPDATVPTRDISFYPICFVFKPGTICKQAKRLYPFDTGASQNGLYEPAINRTDALTAYQVQAVVDNAKRITTCFFETHEDYLSGKPRPGLVFTTAETDAALYYRLINGGGAANCDDRCSAVEIQIGTAVDLREDIMAVVLPTCFLDDDALADTLLKEWRAIPLTYNADIGMRPIEFHGVIRYLVRKFYQDSSLI